MFAGCGIFEEEDCAGVAGGTAELDNCNVCDSDLSNDCIQDCADEWGGSKINDCNGECGGSAVEDECGDCNGGMFVCPISPLCNLDGLDGWLPNCHGYDPDNQQNHCYPAIWVADAGCDDINMHYGADFSCYSYDETGTLCQIPTLSDIESGLPDCIGDHGGPDNGDCDPCDTSIYPDWYPECHGPDAPPSYNGGAYPCDFCCDTFRNPCGVCGGTDIPTCQFACEEVIEHFWGCDEVCYETEGDAPTIDLCGICGGDGSSCGSGD